MSSRFFAGSDSSSESSSDEEELYGAEKAEAEEESSSEEDSDEDEDQDEDSDSDDESAGGVNRFLKSDDEDESSEEEEEKATVVKSAKDKKFDELEATVRLIENAEKIGDWGVISESASNAAKILTAHTLTCIHRLRQAQPPTAQGRRRQQWQSAETLHQDSRRPRNPHAGDT